MTPAPYSEDTLVQQTTAAYLEQELGWESVYAYNNEDFGPDKSYSMVLFTRKVHRKLGGNFTFLILTDRDDLGTQIYKTFAGCGVVDNDRDPCRAASGEHLALLLAQHKSHVFSLIQKFNQTVSEGQAYSRRDYHIITAGKRLDQVARDFVRHYSTAWETGKAMLVCIDKITCVRMHKLIDFYWNERISELEAQLPQAMDEQDEQYRQRQIGWMRQTRMVVVVSEEQGEVEKFRKWELDITPHRRLIKEGIDLPEAMRKQTQFQNMQRLSLDDAFKAEEHPLRVAIVCAMWLAGFDVPSLSTLYLDKPLKAHTLMQAIARANRVSEGKNNGMIVDYCGILKNLRKALATFAGTGDGGRGGDGGQTEPAKPDEELLADLGEAIAFARAFLVERGASLQGIIGQTGFARNAAILSAKEAANENDETRKRFEVMCRAVFSKFKACITVEGVSAVPPRTGSSDGYFLRAYSQNRSLAPLPFG